VAGGELNDAVIEDAVGDGSCCASCAASLRCPDSTNDATPLPLLWCVSMIPGPGRVPEIDDDDDDEGDNLDSFIAGTDAAPAAPCGAYSILWLSTVLRSLSSCSWRC
jgi:hypothetical protein